EIERMSIGAIAQSSRARPVGKHVTKMRIALRAQDFDASHAVAQVFLRGDRAGLDGVEEARPAGTAFVFRVRTEQRRTAAHTDKGAIPFFIEPGTRERAFGCRTASDGELLG